MSFDSLTSKDEKKSWQLPETGGAGELTGNVNRLLFKKWGWTKIVFLAGGIVETQPVQTVSVAKIVRGPEVRCRRRQWEQKVTATRGAGKEKKWGSSCTTEGKGKKGTA